MLAVLVLVRWDMWVFAWLSISCPGGWKVSCLPVVWLGVGGDGVCWWDGGFRGGRASFQIPDSMAGFGWLSLPTTKAIPGWLSGCVFLLCVYVHACVG